MITMRFAGKPVVLLFTLVCFLPFIQSSGTEGATCKYLHKGKTLTTKCQDRPDAYCCGVRNAQCCYKNFEPLDKWWIGGAMIFIAIPIMLGGLCHSDFLCFPCCCFGFGGGHGPFGGSSSSSSSGDSDSGDSGSSGGSGGSD
uniref:Vesicular, overexpressed in cancer, prosurvival protein 1 n=1 Tax=Ciona savignyi TaxID=51511 RepID=H2ZDS7_CIOSA